MAKTNHRPRIVASFACLTLASILAGMTLSCSGLLQARRQEATKSAAKGQEAKEETQSESSATQKQGTEDEAQNKQIFDPLEVNQLPEPIKEVKPEYPGIARTCGYEATVVLKIVVSDSGNVASVEILQSEAQKFKREFEAAAISAVKQYKFKPAIVDGKPVWCMAKVTVNFQLE